MPAKEVKSSKLKVKSSETKKVARVASKASKFSVPVFDLAGKKKGNVELPKAIFGAKVNPVLMAQAVRVYLANQRQGTASTKTRSEVRGSTRKIYRQKGTGRARHGAITAPIFRGGGIALGPKPRDFSLKLSKQMRKKALFSALSQKLSEERVLALDTKGATGKTSQIYGLFKALSLVSKKQNKVLFAATQPEAKRGARNIEGVSVYPPSSINTYEVLNNNYVVFTKDSIEELEKTFLK